jgi:hypothetical protein
MRSPYKSGGVRAKAKATCGLRTEAVAEAVAFAVRPACDAMQALPAGCLKAQIQDVSMETRM